MSVAAFDPLPSDIIVEKTGEGLRFQLPGRELGRWRLVGLVPILFGLAFLVVPVLILSAAFRDVFEQPRFFHAFIGLFLLTFAFGALKPIKYGMLMLCGRCTVEIGREWLRSVDSAGPFHHVRRARVEDIRGFAVKVSGRGTPGFLRSLEHLGTLEARFEEAKAMPLAIGYSREWLFALGNELKRRIDETHMITGHPAVANTLEIVTSLSSASAHSLETEEVDVQPKTSTARLEETVAGATLILPPAGIWRGSKGMMVFSLIWCAFLALFTAGLIVAESSKRSGALIPFVMFLSVFWAIGVGIMLSAINMGRRRAVLAASSTELRVAQENLFGKKSWRWDRNEITAIRVDRSGMEVNGRPMLELQIHSSKGKHTGLFGGRDEAELQWMATLLRKKMAVPGNAELLPAD